MTHTPTPWRIEGDEIRGSDIVHTNGMARNSLGISSASYSDCVCTVHGWMELEHPKANAAFIIKACNAHDELVAALRGLVCELESVNVPAPGLIHAKRALAKAEKGA